MALLSPARSTATIAAETDDRPVLALVDGEQPVEPVLRRAARTATEQEAPLVVALLHPRLGFTTDAAIAARHVRQLQARRDTVADILALVLDGQVRYAVHLVPYTYRPWRDRAGQVRRAAQRCLRLIPAREVVTAEHLLASEVRA
jgi:hypothetical protein